MPSIRCARCGYENHLHQRFCGMCGNGLATNAATQPRIEPTPPTLAETVVEESPAEERPFVTSGGPSFRGGPSFLGLGESSGGTDYLLDDESHHGVARGYVFVLALILAILCGAWVVRTRNPGWLSAQFAQAKIAMATILGSKPAASPAPVAAQSESPPPTAAAGAPPEPAATQAGSTNPDEPPATEKPASPPTPAATVEKIPNEDRDDGQNDVEEGQKYLYGRGVRQDCGRARSSLMTAADLSNAKAQGILGTMYATGHCVPRDLPAAYQWFLKAQQKDPKNVRIEQDLRVVWRQMTAEQQREVGSLRP